MSERYVIWLTIERRGPDGDDPEEFENIGEPEDLAVEFETFEEAEACRTMITELYDTISTHIVKTYAPVYAKVEKLEQELEDAVWGAMGEDL